MQVIDEIIDLLSGNTPSVSEALYKSKVLAHRLGENELKAWVDAELQGYAGDADLPVYRRMPMAVFGQVTNGFQVHNGQRLPTRHLEQGMRDFLETSEVRDSIAVVEDYAHRDGELSLALKPEFYPALQRGLAGGFVVLRAWGKHGIGSYRQIIVEVRSRLLDLMLQLDDRLPDDVASSNIKQLSKQLGVAQMFKGAVFGDNININIGSGSQSQLANTVTKNDFSSLARVLKENGVDDDDIAELKGAVGQDGPVDSESQYGPKVRQWIGGMIAKAGSASWNIGMQAAGGVLASAISHYYGINN
ncbi:MULTISPECIES: AbiTii domain-containing protein [Paraburkholderia]|uniref:AbiTii domain-containing protein n=1 Tax=Paraburkholderia podalyriae TaxID=1938811 RepID=A0ABR7Q2B2_9BURK|nr:hypothetical protein [Paraburkholderia podalyriae]MBC8752682.1 hypothetical protein [Paraburkholderia podalyriae]